MNRLSQRLLMASVVMFVLVCWASSGPADDAKPTKPDQSKKLTVMERKLKYAQVILEGLALNDFDKIRTGADELTKCVKEATWRINDTDKYLAFSNVFLSNLEDLQKAAKKQNLDAATLAYVDMTRSCVKCHTHLRETRMGQLPNRDELRPQLRPRAGE